MASVQHKTGPAVRPDAEPFYSEGGPVAALLCHGFTGSPRTLRPWADYLAAAGLTVSLPRLPGHGTTWRDGNRTGWTDWYDEVSGKPVGVIEDTPGVHGIAIATNVDHGFTTNGKESKVSMFDTKTLALIKKIDVGQKPDGIHFDKATGRVFTNNHGSHDITAIDSDAGVVVGTVAVNGDGEGIV
jgi:DNA-binding beta-propeller fold protein YncE